MNKPAREGMGRDSERACPSDGVPSESAHCARSRLSNDGALHTGPYSIEQEHRLLELELGRSCESQRTLLVLKSPFDRHLLVSVLFLC